jgi:hypothetical protein
VKNPVTRNLPHGPTRLSHACHGGFLHPMDSMLAKDRRIDRSSRVALGGTKIGLYHPASFLPRVCWNSGGGGDFSAIASGGF